MTSPTIRRTSATLTVFSALSALAACAAYQSVQAVGGKTAQQPLEPARITQLGFGPAAHYAVCLPPACPAVTTKTLAMKAVAPFAISTSAAPSEAPANPSVLAEPCPPLRTAKSNPHRIGASDPKSFKNRSADPCGPSAATGVIYIYFANNDHKLDMQAKSAIGDLLPSAAQARSILVTGYTDSIGNNAANRRLASRRAAAVRDYFEFIAPGLADKTVVRAEGACCFVASNVEDTGRSKNRRVEVVLVPAVGSVASSPATPNRANDAGGPGPEPGPNSSHAGDTTFQH